MLGLDSILAAAANATTAPLAATAAPAAVPTPKPLPVVPGSNLFTPVSWGDQHPVLLAIVQYAFIAACVALIAFMSAQTTKTEGLSGTIGGRAESAYRGRLGLSEQLSRATTFTAVVFMVLAVTYFVITR